MSTASHSKAPFRTYPHDAVCADCGNDFRYYSRPSEQLEPHEIPRHCEACTYASYERDQALKATATERAQRIAGDVQAGRVTLASALATLRRAWRDAASAPPEQRRIIQYTAEALKLLAPAPGADDHTIIDYAAPAPAPAPARLDNVAYTAVYGAGARDWLTVKVAPHWDAAKAALGEQVLSYHVGAGGERPYESAAFIAGGTLRLYKQYRETPLAATLARCYAILTRSADDMLTARTEYAKRTGTCARCGKELRVPASLNAGLGPECAKKVGAS